jgi:hypothetical protein
LLTGYTQGTEQCPIAKIVNVGLNPGLPHEIVVAVGKYPMETVGSFCKVTQIPPPEGKDLELAAGKALVWFRNGDQAPST